MARPSKGDRTAHMVPFHPDVLTRLTEAARTAGATSICQYAADVLALHVGLPQHVRELHDELPTAPSALRRPAGDAQGRLMIKPATPVSQALAQQAVAAGLPPRLGPYIADVLALHVGLPERARRLGVPADPAKEVLPLAI